MNHGTLHAGKDVFFLSQSLVSMAFLGGGSIEKTEFPVFGIT